MMFTEDSGLGGTLPMQLTTLPQLQWLDVGTFYFSHSCSFRATASNDFAHLEDYD
jgi:hypothetical protein